MPTVLVTRLRNYHLFRNCGHDHW